MRTNKIYEDNPYGEQDLEIGISGLDMLKGISPTGLKIYVYLREYVFRDSELIFIYIEDIQKGLKYKEPKSVYNGVNELLSFNVISKSKEKSAFYYNKMFFEQKKIY